jgi:superfamily II DNA or RNA helicase
MGRAVTELRPYQHDVVAELERNRESGKRRIIIVAPTASGKTVIAAAIIRQAISVYNRILFIAHRDELLTQARDKLARFGTAPGIIKAGRDKDARPQSLVQIAGIQTLHARAIRAKSMQLPEADIIFVDEAHHIRARTYQTIVEQYPNAIIIGLTATPCRGDGRGLGNVFESMVECPQIGQLIELGFLVRPKIFAPPSPDLRGVEVASTGDYVLSQLSERVNTDPLVGDIVEHWLKHAQHRRTVGFAVDIAHSAHVVEELKKSGVRAEHLDGNTPQAERDAILDRLRIGETEFVSNCQVLTEGFDLPDIGCIVLARPTKSLGLFRQMIGRGLRPAPDKTDVIILDHSGGVHRHGRPDDHIEWTLETDKRAVNEIHESRKAAAPRNADPFCDCPACGLIRGRGMGCDACGWQPKPRGRDVEVADGELVELGKAGVITESERIAFYCELRGYQRTARKKDGSPYHPRWAAAQFKDKFQSWPPWKWDGFESRAPTPATLRWSGIDRLHTRNAGARHEQNFREDRGAVRPLAECHSRHPGMASLIARRAQPLCRTESEIQRQISQQRQAVRVGTQGCMAP